MGCTYQSSSIFSIVRWYCTQQKQKAVTSQMMTQMMNPTSMMESQEMKMAVAMVKQVQELVTTCACGQPQSVTMMIHSLFLFLMMIMSVCWWWNQLHHPIISTSRGNPRQFQRRTRFSSMLSLIHHHHAKWIFSILLTFNFDVCSFIKNNKIYISPFNGNVIAPHVYSHIKTFWLVAKPFTDKERGKTKLQWHNSSQKFDFICLKIWKTINTKELWNIVYLSLANLDQCWSKILLDIVQPADFVLFSLKDDPASSNSLFDTAENVLHFNKYIKMIKAGLLKQGGSSSSLLSLSMPDSDSDSEQESNGVHNPKSQSSPFLVSASSSTIKPKKVKDHFQQTLCFSTGAPTYLKIFAYTRGSSWSQTKQQNSAISWCMQLFGPFFHSWQGISSSTLASFVQSRYGCLKCFPY